MRSGMRCGLTLPKPSLVDPDSDRMMRSGDKKGLAGTMGKRGSLLRRRLTGWSFAAAEVAGEMPLERTKSL